MEMEAKQRCNFNQAEARERMAHWISQDRRFDGYDADRLVERVQRCRSNGAVFDIEAPEFEKGGQKRPLDRSQY